MTPRLVFRRRRGGWVGAECFVIERFHLVNNQDPLWSPHWADRRAYGTEKAAKAAANREGIKYPGYFWRVVPYMVSKKLSWKQERFVRWPLGDGVYKRLPGSPGKKWEDADAIGLRALAAIVAASGFKDVLQETAKQIDLELGS